MNGGNLETQTEFVKLYFEENTLNSIKLEEN